MEADTVKRARAWDQAKEKIRRRLPRPMLGLGEGRDEGKGGEDEEGKGCKGET